MPDDDGNYTDQEMLDAFQNVLEWIKNHQVFPPILTYDQDMGLLSKDQFDELVDFESKLLLRSDKIMTHSYEQWAKSYGKLMKSNVKTLNKTK